MFVINPQKFVVSTHSRLKAAGSKRMVFCWPPKVSTHSRLKAADDKPKEDDKPKTVSTHSRLKAADRHRI